MRASRDIHNLIHLLKVAASRGRGKDVKDQASSCLPSKVMVPLADNDSASDAGPGLAGGVTHVVIGAGVDHQGSPTRP
jgi:hypothetical protein